MIRSVILIEIAQNRMPAVRMDTDSALRVFAREIVYEKPISGQSIIGNRISRDDLLKGSLREVFGFFEPFAGRFSLVALE